MRFEQEDFDKLLNDRQTVVTMTNNDNGQGGRTIIADACIRPHSLIRNDYLNPIRNISHIPTQYVRSCPRCGEEWAAIHTVIAGATEYYGCSDRCGVSICSDTYNRFARVFNKDGVSEDTMPREFNLDVLVLDDDEATLTLELDDEATLTLELDDEEETFNPATGEWAL